MNCGIRKQLTPEGNCRNTFSYQKIVALAVAPVGSEAVPHDSSFMWILMGLMMSVGSSVTAKN